MESQTCPRFLFGASLLLPISLSCMVAAREPSLEMPAELMHPNHPLFLKLSKNPDQFRAKLLRALDGLMEGTFDRTRVNLWIQELGSDQYVTREGAHARLRAQGSSLLPFLTALVKKPTVDPERRERLCRLLYQLRSDSMVDRTRREIRLANVLMGLSRVDSTAFVNQSARLWRQGHREAVFRALRGNRTKLAPVLAALGQNESGRRGDHILKKLLPSDWARAVRAWKATGAVKNVKEALEKGTLPDGQDALDPLFVFRKNHSGSNRQEKKEDRDRFSLAPYAWEIPASGEHLQSMTYDIDGDLWIDTDTGTRYTVKGRGTRIVFLIKGDLYLTDDLVIEEGSDVTLAFIVKKRGDGSGGNIHIGDPAYQTLEQVEGLYFAEGKVMRNKLPLGKRIRIKGMIEAGQKEDPPKEEPNADWIQEQLTKAALDSSHNPLVTP